MSRFSLRGLTPRFVAVASALTVGAATLSGAVSASRSPAPDLRVAATTSDPAGVAPAAPAGAAPASAVPAAAQQRLSAPSTVTLPTGHRIRLGRSSSGPPSVTALPTQATDDARPEEEASFTQFQWDGDTYVVPSVAAPYLGSTLDIRLFNVSYLARAKLDDKHSSALPVTVTYRGRQATRLPGVRADEPTNRKADGRIVKGQAGELGRLLAQRWRAAESGRSTAPVGRLDGVARIELAPAGSAAKLPSEPTMLSTPSMTSTAGARTTARTGPAYHTLTLDPIAPDGDPGVAVGFVQNVDDARLTLAGGLVIAGGDNPVRFGVAEGTYSITTTVLDGPADDYTVESAFVAEPEVAVDSDTTITLDARDAVPFEPTLESPPEAAEYRVDRLTFSRTSEQGGELQVQNAGIGGFVTLINMRLISQPGGPDLLDNGLLSATPTEPVSKGSFGFAGITQIGQNPSDPASTQPQYTMVFPSEDRIPKSLTYSVSDADLTTVRSEVYGTEFVTRPLYVWLPWSYNTLGGSPPVPGERVDYWYTSAPDITVWQQALTGRGRASTDSVRSHGPRRTIEPGEEIVEEWLKGPLVVSPAPSYVFETGVVGISGGVPGDESIPQSAVCAACRQDDNGMLYLTPLRDSEPTHYGRTFDLDAGRVVFYRNGEVAFDSDIRDTGGLRLPMLPEPANYRLDWTWTSQWDQEGHTTTSWRFHSDPEETAVDLPESVLCSPDTGRDCAFLPLLFVTYDLDLTYALAAPAGSPFDLTFRVGGQQHAPQPTGVEATVQVSYDDGQTWTEPRVATSQGDGQFTLPIQHPPLSETSGHVSLRVRAHDDAGNSVEQELIHAYALHGQ